MKDAWELTADEMRMVAAQADKLAAKILRRESPRDEVMAAVDRAIVACHAKGLPVEAMILASVAAISARGGRDRLFYAVMQIAGDLGEPGPTFSRN